ERGLAVHGPRAPPAAAVVDDADARLVQREGGEARVGARADGAGPARVQEELPEIDIDRRDGVDQGKGERVLEDQGRADGVSLGGVRLVADAPPRVARGLRVRRVERQRGQHQERSQKERQGSRCLQPVCPAVPPMAHFGGLLDPVFGVTTRAAAMAASSATISNPGTLERWAARPPGEPAPETVTRAETALSAVAGSTVSLYGSTTAVSVWAPGCAVQLKLTSVLAPASSEGMRVSPTK